MWLIKYAVHAVFWVLASVRLLHGQPENAVYNALEMCVTPRFMICSVLEGRHEANHEM